MIYLEQTTPLSLKSALQVSKNIHAASNKTRHNNYYITTTKATNKSTTILGQSFSLLHYCLFILHAMFDCAYINKNYIISPAAKSGWVGFVCFDLALPLQIFWLSFILNVHIGVYDISLYPN